jgi:hypothetical protein
MTNDPDRSDSPPPIVVVLGRDRPHEVAFNVWALILGLLFTFGAPRPGSLAGLVHGPAFYVFSIGLALGGVVALFGSHWTRDVEMGLEVERGGLIILTGALLVYVAAVTVTFGWQALVAGGLCAAWVYANLRRALTIRADLRRMRRRSGS